MVLWIHVEVTDFSILLISKSKQYKNAIFANLCITGKLEWVPDPFQSVNTAARF